MNRSKDNVILFPTFKEDLEKDSLQAIEEERYSEALEYINELLKYQTYTYEVIVGKLICLIELGRSNEAKVLCEELLEEKDEYYYNYFQIYISALYKLKEYEQLVKVLKKEMDNPLLPHEYYGQFKRDYQIVKQLNHSDQFNQITRADQSPDPFEDLFENFTKDDDVKQWCRVEKYRNMGIYPPEVVITYVKEEKIHPVVKTAIIKWLIESGYQRNFKIHKFDKTTDFVPKDFPTIISHSMYKRILRLIDHIDQKNPTFYSMLRQLLYRYFYVLYPLIPPEDDEQVIAHSLIYIGETYLHLDVSRPPSEKMLSYIKEIVNCEKLYSEIIDE